MIPRQLIDNWLRAENMTSGPADGMFKAEPGQEPDWLFTTLYKPNPKAATLRLLFLGFNRKDLLRIISGVVFSADHQAAMGKDGLASRGALARLRERLLTTNTQFNPILAGTKVVGFQLEANIYVDGLTQDRLMGEVRRHYSLFLFISDTAELVKKGQAELNE